MSKKFKLSSLQRGGARFDFEKAKSISQKYLSAINSELLMSKHPEVFEKLKIALPGQAVEIVDLIKTRVSLIADFELELKTFVEDPARFDMDMVEKVLSSINVSDLDIFEENIKVNIPKIYLFF